MGEVWYRFEEGHDHKVVLRRLDVVKHTPAGVWLGATSWVGGGVWVSKWTNKRYAYPDIKSAADSYLIRKRRQVWHLLSKLKDALANINAMKTKVDLDQEKFNLGFGVTMVLQELDKLAMTRLSEVIEDDEFEAEIGSKLDRFFRQGIFSGWDRL